MIGPDTLEAEAEHTTLRTPAGIPASIINLVKYCEVSGVKRAGLRIMVQPAATAGATLRVAMASGKFHGVIKRHGPTGLWDTIILRLPSGVSAYRP